MREKGLLTATEAARYLGVSRTFFLTSVRPYLKGEVNVAAPQRQKPMPRWTVADLDAWVAVRRTERRSA
jgi:hypothetical protein